MTKDKLKETLKDLKLLAEESDELLRYVSDQDIGNYWEMREHTNRALSLLKEIEEETRENK